MKVILKFDNRTEIVENVSVDEKCFPLVGGVHPYPEASLQSSQLANQSSFWFKTLAIDCIFLDCDKNEVHWFPVVNDVSVTDLDVILRKPKPDQGDRKLLLSVAKPLFDPALYEMNPSVEAMMLTCKDAMLQLPLQKMSRADFHRSVASILHKFILPFIQFSSEDVYCLSRARCLILERFHAMENNIKRVQESVQRYEDCLSTLRSNMLFREKMDNESYLATCSPAFLTAFASSLVEQVNSLNVDLEAKQGKVNWAKQHGHSEEHINGLRAERDRIHADVNNLIKVREAMHNVINRKESKSVRRSKHSKKRKTSVVIPSPSHDLFVEVARQLEVDNRTLDKLCMDKVNISAAREAVMDAISKLSNNNNNHHPSIDSRVTMFEPEDFVDYSMDLESSNGSKQSDLWPTFQERVSALIQKSSSASRQAHVSGCKKIAAQIDLALSEFNLAMIDTPLHNSSSSGEEESTVPESCGNSYEEENGQSSKSVEMRRFSAASRESRSNRSTVCYLMEGRGISIFEPPPQLLEVSGEYTQSGEGEDSDITKSDSLKNLSPDFVDSKVPGDGCLGDGEDPVPNIRRHRVGDKIKESLALHSLDTAVEGIKQSIQGHFSEVVTCLCKELSTMTCDFPLDLTRQKDLQRELLWKAYERIFFESELDKLTTIYNALLKPGLQRAHEKLSTSPMTEVMGDDKILQLFYAPDPTSRVISTARDCPNGREGDKYSMARTISNPVIDVRHCQLEDLYSLANADSSDIQRRFHLESSGEDSDIPSSSGSSAASYSETPGSTSYESSLASQTHSFHSVAEGSPVTSEPITNLLIPPAAEMTAPSPADSGRGWTPGAEEDGMPAPDEVLMLPPAAGDVKPLDSQTSVSSLTSQLSKASLCAKPSGDSARSSDSTNYHKPLAQRPISVTSADGSTKPLLEIILQPFHQSIRKCLNATSFLDKLRYITRSIEGLHQEVWQLLEDQEETQASCDDVLSMLIMALCHIPEDDFVKFYINVRMLSDISPSFLDGTLWNCSLVNLYAAYDFLFSRNVCEGSLGGYSSSLRRKF